MRNRPTQVKAGMWANLPTESPPEDIKSECEAAIAELSK
jgi:hypothetical protein